MLCNFSVRIRAYVVWCIRTCTKHVERISLMQRGSNSATSSPLLAFVRCTAVSAGSLAAICEEQA